VDFICSFRRFESCRCLNTTDIHLLRRTAKKGVLFSIGVICYLLHLVFTGRVEIHNIVNLRNDVERLLEC
ncbi:unnamed protein product, partial [Brassica oleracea]